MIRLSPRGRLLVAGVLSVSATIPGTSAVALSVSSLARAAMPLLVEPVPCATRARGQTTSWASPLDRTVSAHVAETSLREALDRVASLSRVELSYSVELLPADRRVCVALDRVTVGALLETLLEGTTLRAVVVGASHVVLAPTRGAAASAPVTSATRRASVLDRVVVTGTPDGGSHRASPFALDVIDASTLARANPGTLGEALELAVPGVWTWNGSAGSVSARFGSVRGASSFGVTTPKIYLDGVEVANPLLVMSFDASRIERIEVIRGPQGAALYGADAISGVVNILTRHDGSPTGAPVLQVSTRAGRAETAYASRDAFVQEHSASLRAGSGARTAGLGLSLGTVGAYVPGASERRLLADGDLRLVQSHSVVTVNAKMARQRANGRTGPLPESLPAAGGTRYAGDSASGHDLAQYTLGATITVMPSLRWTHSLIAGVDGYRLRGIADVGQPLLVSPVDDPAAARGSGDRASLRTRAVGRFDIADQTVMSLTFGVELATTRELTEPLRLVVGNRAAAGDRRVRIGAASIVSLAPDMSIPDALATVWTTNSGVLGQASIAWRDALFVHVGGRAERNVGGTPNAQVAFLPMLGATFVHDGPGLVLKLRSAFGTGIRPAHTLARAAAWMGRTGTLGVGALQPESQSGTEAGVDLLMGRAVMLHVTRFDQRASGLIQPVGTATSSMLHGRRVYHVGYTLENVGAITNRGWEVQGSTTLARVRLAGAYTLVDSRVAEVSQSYGGELRAGDRMLDVPARTLSATAWWLGDRLTASATLARADDWIGYDRIAIGRAIADPERNAPVGGAGLRDFWVRHDDVTRLRSTLSWRVSPQLAMEVAGENLLNVQRGAPDNATITAGRTLTVGLRTQF